MVINIMLTSMFNNLFKKNQIKKPEHLELQVKLKSINGIHPGAWLSAIYLTIFLILFFLFFFLPGILNTGTRVYFKSFPTQSSVWINGEFTGTTPFIKFLPTGENEVVFRKPGFIETGKVLRTRGYIFATLFKRPEVIINKNLEISNYADIFNHSLDDILRWAIARNFHESYQPEYLVAKTISMFRDGGRGNQYAERFLEKSFKNITSENLFKDFIRALLLNRNGNNALLPYDIIDSFSYFAESFTENPAKMIHLLSILRNPNLINITAADRDSFILAIDIKRMQGFQQQAASGGTKAAPYIITINNNRYVAIPAGNYFTGEYPQTRRTINNHELAPTFSNFHTFEKFYMAENKVTNREFLDFINENPLWSRSNIRELIRKNLVTESYLSHWADDYTPMSNDMNMPVYNISWFAAEAYAKWLTGRINRDNLKAVLPDEYMWEVAQRNAGNMLNMMTNVLWAWCSNWFNYADYINPSRSSSLNGIEKSVRGGSWANRPGEIQPFTRASQPPHWCTPFTGFRVALVSENR
ncbi:MAG: SUMF1/EgtB/PvdO family nonheme iron enzyme [Spirochaetes bacterium]|nr:SUMF1/EgtB/PvdO family nonheme iron enzyme [Spirochaetota bacterium]